MSRMTASLGVALLSFVAVACGSTKSPTAPAPVSPPPAPAVTTYSLTGSVVQDTSSGSIPAEGAHIDVLFGDSGHLEAVAAGDGRYAVAGVSAGSATVRVTKDGFVSEERQVQLSADMTLDFDLKANQ